MNKIRVKMIQQFINKIYFFFYNCFVFYLFANNYNKKFLSLHYTLSKW